MLLLTVVGKSGSNLATARLVIVAPDRSNRLISWRASPPKQQNSGLSVAVSGYVAGDSVTANPHDLRQQH